jgi:hypothetical protein
MRFALPAVSLALLAACDRGAPPDKRFNNPPMANEAAVTAEIVRIRGLSAPSDVGVIRPTQTVCAGQLPAGWIKINDSWNPTSCGNPTSITYNVWQIERYDDKPVGASMTACFATVPAGWAMTSSWWNPTTCGHPTSITNNVMSIKRLN